MLKKLSTLDISIFKNLMQYGRGRGKGGASTLAIDNGWTADAPSTYKQWIPEVCTSKCSHLTKP